MLSGMLITSSPFGLAESLGSSPFAADATSLATVLLAEEYVLSYPHTTTSRTCTACNQAVNIQTEFVVDLSEQSSNPQSGVSNNSDIYPRVLNGSPLQSERASSMLALRDNIASLLVGEGSTDDKPIVEHQGEVIFVSQCKDSSDSVAFTRVSMMINKSLASACFASSFRCELAFEKRPAQPIHNFVEICATSYRPYLSQRRPCAL